MSPIVPIDTTLKFNLIVTDIDRLATFTDSLSNQRRYGYGKLGNRISVIDPDAKQTRYRIDGNSRLKEVIQLDSG